MLNKEEIEESLLNNALELFIWTVKHTMIHEFQALEHPMKSLFVKLTQSSIKTNISVLIQFNL
jgi:hypothetical protein